MVKRDSSHAIKHKNRALVIIYILIQDTQFSVRSYPASSPVQKY